MQKIDGDRDGDGPQGRGPAPVRHPGVSVTRPTGVPRFPLTLPAGAYVPSQRVWSKKVLASPARSQPETPLAWASRPRALSFS